ncbi:MAG: hypothetical protein U0T81_00630 [Saprospiraceae bacterium]
MKNFFAMVLISCILLNGCTSKNRFEKSSDGNTKETYNPTPTSGPNPTKDQIKGSITDVESDAIPFLKIEADTPRWSMNMGLIQEGIFDVKLNMSSENKIYFGLLKKFNSPTTQEYFMSGSSIPTVANKSYSCMLKDSLALTTSKNNITPGLHF